MRPSKGFKENTYIFLAKTLIGKSMAMEITVVFLVLLFLLLLLLLLLLLQFVVVAFFNTSDHSHKL